MLFAQIGKVIVINTGEMIFTDFAKLANFFVYCFREETTVKCKKGFLKKNLLTLSIQFLSALEKFSDFFS